MFSKKDIGGQRRQPAEGSSAKNLRLGTISAIAIWNRSDAPAPDSEARGEAATPGPGEDGKPFEREGSICVRCPWDDVAPAPGFRRPVMVERCSVLGHVRHADAADVGGEWPPMVSASRWMTAVPASEAPRGGDFNSATWPAQLGTITTRSRRHDAKIDAFQQFVAAL